MHALTPDVRSALASDMTIDITTTGRHSGQPRRIEIWFLNIEGTLYIAGTPGPRDWLANLRAEPRFTFHLKQRVVADLDAVATEVHDVDERRAVFESAEAGWYRGQCPVARLVDSAPLVRVNLVGDG